MIARVLLAALAMVSLGGCATGAALKVESSRQAVFPERTNTQVALRELPPPSRPVAVAVYAFVDQTGQYKPIDSGQTLSRAVSQGGSSILVKALQDAGQRQWFTVVEREMLKNLLQERQIIREMRERYLGETGPNPDALPSLLFAGVLLEGGVIGYDTNTLTGGMGARFLGIGANVQYRQDTVTVYLRAVSVRTGEVLVNVTASKTIASQSLGAGAFRYVGYKDLLETEAGFTTNEPDLIAVQQAVEKAVYGLIMEGIDQRLWGFADPRRGGAHYERYLKERDGVISVEQAQSLAAKARKERLRKIAKTTASARTGVRSETSSRTAFPEADASGTSSGNLSEQLLGRLGERDVSAALR